jgi:uncharacterized membrane protein
MGNSINVNIIPFSQLIAALFTGLLAGLFYGYECSVIKGLGNLQDEVYLQSFQSINKAIQNPYFFIIFMGSLVVLPVATWLCYDKYSLLTFYLLLAATVLYIVGVFGVTIFGNVPLNEALDRLNLQGSTVDEIAKQRAIFETAWNQLHTIRTIAAVASFALVLMAFLNKSGGVK